MLPKYGVVKDELLEGLFQTLEDANEYAEQYAPATVILMSTEEVLNNFS